MNNPPTVRALLLDTLGAPAVVDSVLADPQVAAAAEAYDRNPSPTTMILAAAEAMKAAGRHYVLGGEMARAGAMLNATAGEMLQRMAREARATDLRGALRVLDGGQATSGPNAGQ